MTALPKAVDLPYHLPTDTKGQLKALAKILDIAPAVAEQAGEAGVEAMTSTILYRHLDRRQRMVAMEKIKSLPDKVLVSKLVKLTLDMTFVNPQWGLWSMSNEELADDIRFHQAINKIGAVTGASLSFSSGKDLINEVLKNGRLGPRGVALLVIGVAFWGNDSELGAAIDEQKRRSQIKDSQYYR